MKPLLTLATLTALALSPANPALAHDGEDYLGSVFMFGLASTQSGFCPRGSMEADGSLLQISQFSALFSLFGAAYGGDGRSTFGLPDFRDAAPISANGQKIRYCVVVQGIYPSRN